MCIAITSKTIQGIQRGSARESSWSGYSIGVWWYQHIQMDCSYQGLSQKLHFSGKRWKLGLLKQVLYLCFWDTGTVGDSLWRRSVSACICCSWTISSSTSSSSVLDQNIPSKCAFQGNEKPCDCRLFTSPAKDIFLLPVFFYFVDRGNMPGHIEECLEPRLDASVCV